MICPTNKDHKHFITGAAVCQDWLVDGVGDFIEVADACTQVLHRPDVDNEWSCSDCGSVGVSNEK
jgi:hypothetical protein